MNAGTLGGKFTTIEGILKDCRENLNQVSPFLCGGDSDKKESFTQLKAILDKLELIQNGKMLNVTIILDDPSGNSYLQNVYAPEDDPNMKMEHYIRDHDQNELLGLNDMKTENYTAD
jgi:zinc finger protein